VIRVRRRRRKVDLPAEVVVVLRDDPGALAIADAIRATRAATPSRAPLRWRVAAPLVATAATVAIIFAFLFSGGGKVALIDEARAALTAARFLHVTAVRMDARDRMVDLRDGRSSSAPYRIELWLDVKAGKVVQFQPPFNLPAAPARKPALGSLQDLTSHLLLAYRNSLLSRAETVELAGTRSLVIRYAGVASRVSLTPNGLPHQFAARGRSVDLTALPTSRAPTQGPAGSIVSETKTSPARVRARIGGGRDLGQRFKGLPLRGVRLQQLLDAAATHRRVGAAYLYGALSARYLEIDQSRRPEPVYGFISGRSFAGNRLSHDLLLDLHQVAQQPSLWMGQFRNNGVYYTLRSSSAQLLLAAASALARTGH
jgi:hypothetical protein